MTEQPLLFVGLDGEMTGSGSRERGVVASQKYQLIQIGLALPDGRMFRSDIGFDTWNEQPEAMAVNKFFEPSVRIQTDRGHKVIDTGPYAIVRHPGYALVYPLFLGIPLALGSLWALVPAILTIALPDGW